MKVCLQVMRFDPNRNVMRSDKTLKVMRSDQALKVMISDQNRNRITAINTPNITHGASWNQLLNVYSKFLLVCIWHSGVTSLTQRCRCWWDSILIAGDNNDNVRWKLFLAGHTNEMQVNWQPWRCEGHNAKRFHCLYMYCKIIKSKNYIYFLQMVVSVTNCIPNTFAVYSATLNCWFDILLYKFFTCQNLFGSFVERKELLLRFTINL